MEGLDFTNTMPSPGAPNYADLDLGMTFGIELECIAVYPTGLMAPPGQPGDAITAISLGMKAMGINSTGHETLEDDVPIWGEGEEYSQWIVQAEGGLELSEAELRTLKRFANGVEYDVQPLEISSRILDFRGNWIDEIRKVLSVLTALRTQGCSFAINSTTGFHVHIGFGRQRIPLKTAKAVLQFCTGFEDRLDSVYSIDRINEKCAENVQPGQHFNAGLAWHFQHNPRTDFGPNVFHWLTEIEEAPSFEALGKFFCNDLPGDTNCYKDKTDAHFSTLNLENLYQSPLGDWDSTTSPSGTIEFRQHQGVLHFDAIYMQILLTRAIVTFCHSAPEVDFLQLFAKICDPSFGLIDLLKSIGCPQILIQYYQDRRSDSELNDAMAEYLETVVELEAGEFQGSDALDAQTFIETFERSNWPAVLSKIEAKRAAGAYGEHDTRYMVVWLEFAKFYIDRCQYFSGVEAKNMTRAMIFQQLNGDDIWTDPTDEEMSGFTLE